MIKDAINRILDLAPAQLMEIGGHTWATKSLTPVTEVPVPPLQFSTLAGLQGYVSANVDRLNLAQEDHGIYIAVENYHTARVMRSVAGVLVNNVRVCLAEAKLQDHGLPRQEFMPSEQMLLMLQARFQETQNQMLLIQTLSSIVEKSEISMEDDGVTQAVKTKRGAMLKNTGLPRVIDLVPWVTFPEVDQPTCQYTLRGERRQDGIMFALVEAGGGLWKTEAVRNIVRWLGRGIVTVIG